MCSSCRVSECAAEYERRVFLSSVAWWSKKRRRGRAPRRRPVGCYATSVLVAGGLDLVEPIGRRLEVEVQLLILEVGPAVLEVDLAGRILRLRANALVLDTRSRTGDLRAGLRDRARGEVRALRTVGPATPGGRRILSEDHRRDGQHRYRNPCDSRPPHVPLSIVLRFTAPTSPCPRCRNRFR